MGHYAYVTLSPPAVMRMRIVVLVMSPLLGRITWSPVQQPRVRVVEPLLPAAAPPQAPLVLLERRDRRRVHHPAAPAAVLRGLVPRVLANVLSAPAAPPALCLVAPRDDVPHREGAPGEPRHLGLGRHVAGRGDLVAARRVLLVAGLALGLFLVLPRLLACLGYPLSDCPLFLWILVGRRKRGIRTELPLCYPVLDPPPFFGLGYLCPVIRLG